MSAGLWSIVGLLAALAGLFVACWLAYQFERRGVEPTQVPAPVRDYWATEVAAQQRRRDVERQMIERARRYRENEARQTCAEGGKK